MTITAEQMVNHHFFTAKDGRKPTAQEAKLIDAIHDKVKELGYIIFLDVPQNRNRSLAVTALEEASMRAIRAVFEKPLPLQYP